MRDIKNRDLAYQVDQLTKITHTTVLENIRRNEANNRLHLGLLAPESDQMETANPPLQHPWNVLERGSHTGMEFPRGVSTLTIAL
jgi:hypothetical protein